MIKSKQLVLGQIVFFIVLCASYFLVVWPAMNGPFVLDDWWNLQKLTEVDDWKGVFTFTFSGYSSYLGRPVSLLSFALQAEHWSQNSFPFKFVNAIIHLFNSMLLYGCAYFSASFLGFSSKRKVFFAVAVCVLWLFLPINTSTIFYVIQRMTLLSSTFILMGILGVLYGVTLDIKSGNRWGLVLASISMVVAYVFGILSKENAILLGIYIGVMYCIFIRGCIKKDRKLWDVWLVVFSFLPLLMLFTYITWDAGFLSGYRRREFTVIERLLTEWRILWDYLFKIILPTSDRINLYNDDFVISRGLFNPVSTLVAGVGWVFVTALSWKLRSKLPFILFGISWYLGGHLLESTIVGLELYYEHRNYLPSIGVIIALVWFVFSVFDYAEGLSTGLKKKVSYACFTFFVVSLPMLHFSVFSIEVKSWEHKRSFYKAALNDRPDSFRVNESVAIYVSGAGNIQKSADIFYAIDQRWPGSPGVFAHLLYLQCLDMNVVVPTREELEERFLTGRFANGNAGPVFAKMHEFKHNGGCLKISWNDYRSWVSALMKNPNFPKYGIRQLFLQLKVLSYVSEGDFPSALSVLEDVGFSRLNVDSARQKVDILMLLGRNKDALDLIQKIKVKFSRNKKVWITQEEYFVSLENKINEKMKKITRVFEIN